MTIKSPAIPRVSTALRTDHYELTMLQAALRSGIAHHRAVFEVFARELPDGRRYGVVAGLGRFLDALEAFRFGPEEIDYLSRAGWLKGDALEYLKGYRFSGSIDAYREGELYWAGSPVLTIDAPFAEALLLETIVLSVLNFDSAVASAAARIVQSGGDRPIIEMGGRRTHDAAAVAAARAAFVVGFASTSNLEAGRRYGIPTAGTSSHAFTLAHPDERAAFSAQVEALGPQTTLLVDTYDVPEAIRTAVEVGGPQLGAIRIDSGDLAFEAKQARALLDDLGATKTHIVASGDLDEFRIAELADAPIDAFGVGTSVVTGSGAPTASFIYKLVARAETGDRSAPLIPVAKRSTGKETEGGRKHAFRLLDADGFAHAELVSIESNAPDSPHRSLQQRVVRNGEVVESPDLHDVRRHHRAALAELRPGALSIEPGPPALEVITRRQPT